MTLVVTRNLPDRYRGFLASVMCEVTLGVYTSVKMSTAVRERVWNVLSDWFEATCEPGHAIVMTYPDARAVGGQAFRTLGTPKVDLVEHDGLMHRSMRADGGDTSFTCDARGAQPTAGIAHNRAHGVK